MVAACIRPVLQLRASTVIGTGWSGTKKLAKANLCRSARNNDSNLICVLADPICTV